MSEHRGRPALRLLFPEQGYCGISVNPPGRGMSNQQRGSLATTRGKICRNGATSEQNDACTSRFGPENRGYLANCLVRTCYVRCAVARDVCLVVASSPRCDIFRLGDFDLGLDWLSAL